MKARRYIILALGLVVTLSAVSCKKEKLKREEARRINVTVSGVAQGTRLGVFFGKPLGLSNVGATVGKDGVLEFDQDVKWNDKQQEYTTVTVYGAYDKSITSLLSNNLSAKADQSTKEDFESSEIVFAKMEAAPLRPVKVELGRINKIVSASFSIPEGEAVQSVSFIGIRLADNLNLLSGGVIPVELSGGEVKPYLTSDNAGVKTYKAYVAESSGNPTVIVRFQSGREVKFMASDKVYEVPDFDVNSLTEPGIYNHKGAVVYQPGEFDQIAYGTASASRTFRVMDLDSGSEFSLTLASKTFAVGADVAATVSMSGIDVPGAADATLSVVRVGAAVTLEDTANNLYYVIPLE